MKSRNRFLTAVLIYIGGITWLMLDRLETLQELNEAVQEFLPDGTIIIGSDGGSELYGVNASGTYLNLPETMEEEYIRQLIERDLMKPDEVRALPKKECVLYTPYGFYLCRRAYGSAKGKWGTVGGGRLAEISVHRRDGGWYNRGV